MQHLKILFNSRCNQMYVIPIGMNGYNLIWINVKFIDYPSVNIFCNLVTFLIKIQDIGELEGYIRAPHFLLSDELFSRALVTMDLYLCWFFTIFSSTRHTFSCIMMSLQIFGNKFTRCFICLLCGLKKWL